MQVGHDDESFQEISRQLYLLSSACMCACKVCVASACMRACDQCIELFRYSGAREHMADTVLITWVSGGDGLLMPPRYHSLGSPTSM